MGLNLKGEASSTSTTTTSTTQNINSYCTFNQSSLVCSNFESYSQLKFSTFTEQPVQILILNPRDHQVLNNDLDLNQLNVKSNYEVILTDVNKIDFISNPFAAFNASIKNRLIFMNSVFELVYENKNIEVDVCNYLAQNELFISLVETGISLVLENVIFSSYPYCQYFFNRADLEYFKISNLNSTNKFKFFDNSLITLRTDLNSTINEFVISESDFLLDSKFLDSLVFEKLHFLSIVNSTLREIETDLFKSFSFLKVFELNLNNFDEFIHSSQNNNTWFSFLNINVSVNLNNQTDVENNIEQKMFFYLTDINRKYLYPEEDFCLFKSFPHSRLVIPRISTKLNLDCTCTLLWLLQYKSFYQEPSINELDTPSVSKCLNNRNFDQLVRDCDFEYKIKFVCNEEASTTSKTAFTTTQLINPYCTIKQIILQCLNFTSYSQLEFSTFTEQPVEILNLIPNEPLVLDNDLNLDKLNLKSDYEVVLLKISKIDFLSNPFAVFNASIKNKIILEESVFELVYENKVIDEALCSNLAQNEIFISLVETASLLILGENTIYSSDPYCQFFFNRAKLDYFEVSNLNYLTNKFEFFDSSLIDLRDDFTSSINEFVIAFSDFILNSKLLEKSVFKNINSLRINKSYLRDVQIDLFKWFSNLKFLEVRLYNFEEFVHKIQNNDKNSSWLSYLNINISVDLNNATDFNNNKDFKLQFYLVDLNETYSYPEEDFCFFKDFPHSKLVVPKIFTKKNLECTCTLLYLLQHKSLYQEGSFNYLDTNSVSKCLFDPNFDQLVINCDFENKIKYKCNKETTTSTTSTTSTLITKPALTTPNNPSTTSPSSFTTPTTVIIISTINKESPSPFESSTIILSVLVGVLFVASISGIIYFKRFSIKSRLSNWKKKDSDNDTQMSDLNTYLN